MIGVIKYPEEYVGKYIIIPDWIVYKNTGSECKKGNVVLLDTGKVMRVFITSIKINPRRIAFNIKNTDIIGDEKIQI